MTDYVDDPDIDGRRTERIEEEKQAHIDAMSAKAFLMHRTYEYIKVPIVCASGAKEFEIRARLSKEEKDSLSGFFDRLQASLEGNKVAFDDPKADYAVARFLAYITKDAELDEEFWMMPELDQTISREIIDAHIKEPAKRLAEAVRFRRDPRGYKIR